MVVFTCNHCGDSIQKPRVVKHYETTCRNPISLTCVDCFKDFRLQEYVVHIKCLTEEERYSAKGSVQKVQKGHLKQTSWVETVNAVIDQEQNSRPGIKNLLQIVSKYSNIPRKKVKFINFLKSASGNRANINDIEQVWDLIETHTKKIQADNKTIENRKSKPENDTATTENGVSELNGQEKSSKKKKKSKTKTEEVTETRTVETKVGKKKKRKAESEQADSDILKKKPEENTNDTLESPKKKVKNGNKKAAEKDTETEDSNDIESPKKKEKNGNKEAAEDTKTEDSIVNEQLFSWKQAVVDILSKKTDGLSKDRLQSKVFKKYKKINGPVENVETLIKKYNKKLKALKTIITFENDLYKLIES